MYSEAAFCLNVCPSFKAAQCSCCEGPDHCIWQDTPRKDEQRCIDYRDSDSKDDESVCSAGTARLSKEDGRRPKCIESTLLTF